MDSHSNMKSKKEKKCSKSMTRSFNYIFRPLKERLQSMERSHETYANSAETLQRKQTRNAALLPRSSGHIEVLYDILRRRSANVERTNYM